MEAQLKCSMQMQVAWGINKELEACERLQGCDRIASQRRCGRTSVTGWLQWKGTGCLGSTGREDREGGVTFFANDQRECLERDE